MKQKGFTLIELSIVLVIIGLIIGGILVGRDLINAAAARAQISQIEKYHSAVNAFKNKYGGLPGDLSVSLITQFGFHNDISCGPQGQRDGNGLVEGWHTGATLDEGVGETGLFWQDLSMSGLIDQAFPNSGATTNGCLGMGGTPSGMSLTPGTAYLGDFFPTARIGYGNFIYAYSINGNNWYGLSALTSLNTAATLSSNTTIPIIQAYNMDKKIDDGLPTTGSVIAVYINGSNSTTSTAPTGPADTLSTCYSGSGSSFSYSLSATTNQGTQQNCALSFKFE